MYKHVNVTNFTDSWADGLAFCALIHSFHPDLIPYDTLKPEDKKENLKLAFDVAEKLGIPSLLEPEDMLIASGPDKFSVITYLSQFFHHFKGATSEPINVPQTAAHDDDAIRKKREQMEADLKKRSKKCTKCSEPLSGTAIEALGTTWHQKCFVCYACDKPFQDNKFINVDNKPYCQPCGKKAFKAKTQPKESTANPPCAKCGELCEKETVEALGQSWHVKCFVCTMCSKAFGGNKFINVDNKPYCEQCGRKAFVSGRMQRRNSTADLKKVAAAANDDDEEKEKDKEKESAPTPKPKAGGSFVGAAQGGSALARSASVQIQKPAQVIPETSKEAETYRPKMAAAGIGMADRKAAFQKPKEEPAKPEPARPAAGSRDMNRAKSAFFEKKMEEAKKPEIAKKEEELERIREEKKKQRLAEEERQKKAKEEEEAKRKEQEELEKAKREEARRKREEERKKKEEEEEARREREAEAEELR
jgi:uncharacterized CHY-type Zn-finger protein